MNSDLHPIMLSLDEVLVIAGGIAAIVWVIWYFFFAGSTSTPPTHEHR